MQNSSSHNSSAQRKGTATRKSPLGPQARGGREGGEAQMTSEAAFKDGPTAAGFQQAKTAPFESQFLQIVAKPKGAARSKSKAKPEPKLTRVNFKVSRLMEFCSERELQNQTGHALYDWPLVVGKEVMDNALDECEEAEVAPVISITVGRGLITIQDNGRGIETDTIRSVLDYTIRVSSRKAYVPPTSRA